jgi:Protein of unknown function (DUF3024)
MPLSEIERKGVEKAMIAFMEKRRPPKQIRQEVDLDYRIFGQSVELFEIRPQWNKPEVILEHPFAKATLIRAQKVWKVYWIRTNPKWRSYEPAPKAGSIARFLEIVDQDEYRCFFG